MPNLGQEKLQVIQKISFEILTLEYKKVEADDSLLYF